MKLHIIGSFEQDGREIKGVILEGTTEEVRAIAKLYAAGQDDFRVVASREPSFTVSRKYVLRQVPITAVRATEQQTLQQCFRGQVHPLAVSPGDWIITTAYGSVCVMSDAAFNREYEEMP